MTTMKHTTRAEANALSEAVREHRYPHLAAIPLIWFEWLQRPENILVDYLRWSDYRPTERTKCVRIVHLKTGEIVWHPLNADGARFCPELEDYLSQLPRLTFPIVVSPGSRGPSRIYLSLPLKTVSSIF